MSNNVKKVKEILNIETTDLDKYLEFCETNISDKILNICNIEVIPDSLNSLIQEFLIEQCIVNKNGVGEGVQQVSSVSDNGQKVDLNTVGGVGTVSKNAMEFLNKNMDSLVAYRRIRW